MKIEFDDNGIYGQCPVQAEGNVDGHNFYFRARGETISIVICKRKIESVHRYNFWETDDNVWIFREKYSEGWPFAGRLSKEESLNFIQLYCQKFLDEII